MADVPDERLAKIAAVLKPKKICYTKVAILDTPGLTVDDRKDNPRRLGILREANGIVVVLDGFSRTDLASQLMKFREDMLYADLEIVSNRVPKVEQMFKKVRDAGMSRRFVGGTDLVPDHLHHDGRAVILDHHHLQSVVQSKAGHLVRHRGGDRQQGNKAPAQPSVHRLSFLPASPDYRLWRQDQSRSTRL